MSVKHLHRLLEPTPEETIFVSGKADDPRVGDLLGQGSQSAPIRIGIVGIPQSIGIERNGGRRGAELGPHHIRTMLYKMATSAIELGIREGAVSIRDYGNIKVNGRTLEQVHDDQTDVVETLLEDGVTPVILGGGHDIAWPTIRAIESVGLPYQVANIDAHADVRPLLEGSRAHSGSPFRQMLESDPTSMIEGGFLEFGLQHNGVSRSHLEYLSGQGARVVMLNEVREQGALASWQHQLSHSDVGLYLSLDVDGFASAFAPGVSAPSADGFTPDEIGSIIRWTSKNVNCLVFDVVEVSPPHDADNRTSKLAAAMVLEFLSGICQRALAH